VTCFIDGTPACPDPLPPYWLNTPAYYARETVFSQMVAQNVVGTPYCGAVYTSAPSKSETCDGATIYHAAISVSNTKITAITATSWADNVLTLDLIGAPYLEQICAPPQWCIEQDYKAYNYPPRSGTINHVLSLTCSAPAVEITVPQVFACK
jgi:uncharacterized Zn-finger protein